MLTHTPFQDLPAQPLAPAPAPGDQLVTVEDLQRLLADNRRVLIVLPDGSADVHPEALAQTCAEVVHAGHWRTRTDLAAGQWVPFWSADAWLADAGGDLEACAAALSVQVAADLDAANLDAA